MCASSCWKRRTRVRPERAPENSLRCSTPKSAMRSGSSRCERVRMSNMTQWPGQFIGFIANLDSSTSKLNMFSYRRGIRASEEGALGPSEDGRVVGAKRGRAGGMGRVRDGWGDWGKRGRAGGGPSEDGRGVRAE